MKRIRRRDFIKYSVGLAGLFLVGKYAGASLACTGKEDVTEEAATETTERVVDGLGTVIDRRNKFVMVIDVGACIGCTEIRLSRFKLQ